MSEMNYDPSNGRIEVSEEGLILRLENIKSKLEENDLLDEDDEMTIAILIAHLEELKG